MICVECDEPVQSLITEYTNGHIKLTDCPKCSKTSDKYVEFDSVLLFIDVLLMKPQAYKHLVFNLVSDDEAKDKESWFGRTRVHRIRFLSVLFEIYLTWAYEEKHYNTDLPIGTYSIAHSILQRPVVIQYILFAVKCISDDLITHWLVQFLVFHWLRWTPKTLQLHKGSQNYFKHALSLTIILSGGTKLFPILMLIWPYDDMTITSVINSVANLNLIESLRIVTGCSYPNSICVFAIVTLVKQLVTKSLLAFILSNGDLSIWNKYLTTEYTTMLSKLHHIAQHFMK